MLYHHKSNGGEVLITLCELTFHHKITENPNCAPYLNSVVVLAFTKILTG